MDFSLILYLFKLLPFFLGIYFFLPNTKTKNFLILIFGIILFSSGNRNLALLIILMIFFNHFSARFLQRNSDDKNRKTVLFINIAFNTLMLYLFRYFPLSSIFRSYKVNPIGYFIFYLNSIAYIIDIYVNKANFKYYQRDILDLGAYLCFFPSFIIGPPLRYIDVEKSFATRKFNLKNIENGIINLIMGAGKVVIISMQMSIISDMIFSIPQSQALWLVYLLGLLSVLFKYYYLFLGYAQIALGLGYIIGIKLPKIFLNPLSSISVEDLWNRIFIPFVAWFKTYVYDFINDKFKEDKSTKFKTVVLCSIFVSSLAIYKKTMIIIPIMFILLYALEFYYFDSLDKEIADKRYIFHIKRTYTIIAILVSCVALYSANFNEFAYIFKGILSFKNKAYSYSQFFFILREYFIIYIIAILGCSNLFRNLGKKLKRTKNGLLKAMYFVFVIFVFLLTIIYIAK